MGLGYLRLGQPLNQLSGGEAQRIKLLRYLSDEPVIGESDESDDSATALPKVVSASRQTRLFILDEPTTGLHFEDIRLLLGVMQRLVDQGDSLVVIEHNLDVLKCADWLIDLGPEAELEGGRIVAAGTPENVAATPASHTGKYLAPKFETRKSGSILREATKTYGRDSAPDEESPQGKFPNRSRFAVRAITILRTFPSISNLTR